MFASLLVMGLTVVVSAPLATDTRISDEIETILKDTCKKYNVPGATAAVATPKGLIAKVAFGIRKFGEPNPILPDDAMHLGSNTKSMTAVVIAKLVQAEKLHFDDPVAKFFPEVKSVNPAFKTLTVRHLLNQQSGLPARAGQYNYLPTNTPGTEPQKRVVYVKTILQEQLNTEPGTKYDYNNANYILLGAIAEKLTGQSYEEVVTNKVFKPFGLTTFGFGPMGDGRSAATPWQHVYEGGKPKPVYFDNPDWFTPAGRVHLSAPELVKYGIRHLREDPGFLSSQLWHELHIPPKGSPYSMGWIRLDTNDYGHAGSNTLSCSEIWIRKDRQVVFAVCFNSSPPGALSECMRKVDAMLAKNGQ